MISDLRMSVINGVQLLKTVKDLNPSTRTILMTGYDFYNNLLQEYTKKEIIDCCLRKPIEFGQLLSEVNKQIYKIKMIILGVANAFLILLLLPAFFHPSCGVGNGGNYVINSGGGNDTNVGDNHFG
jgi:hypothetical protein